MQASYLIINYLKRGRFTLVSWNCSQGSRQNKQSSAGKVPRHRKWHTKTRPIRIHQRLARRSELGCALQAALYNGHDNIVQLLLTNGVDFNIQGGYYGCTLQAAAYRGHEKLCSSCSPTELMLTSRVGTTAPLLRVWRYSVTPDHERS